MNSRSMRCVVAIASAGIILLAVICLSGCGGGGGGGSSNPGTQTRSAQWDAMTWDQSNWQ